MADQEIRLRSTYDGSGAKAASASMGDVRASTVQATAATYELADVYEVLTTELSEADRAMDRLVADAVEATRAQRLMRQSLDELTPATAFASAGVTRLADAKDRAARSGANLGQSFLNLGRITQDAAQGGFGGILNNIEGMTASLGLGSGLAGTLTVVGVGLFLFKDQLADAAEASGLLETKIGSEGLLGAFEKVETQLKATAKELDALKEKQSLTSDEVDRYNTLSARQVELDKQKSAEMEKQKRIAALGALKDPEEEKAAKDRADQLKADVGGDQAAIVSGVLGATSNAKVDALTREIDARVKLDEELVKRYVAGEVSLSESIERGRILIKEVQRKRDLAIVARNQEAQDRVARAVVEGDATAIGEVRDAMGRNPNAFTPEQRRAFDDAAAGVNKKADAKATKAAGDADRKASDEEAAAIRKMVADGLAAEDDERNREGKRVEALAEGERKAAEKKAAEKARADKQNANAKAREANKRAAERAELVSDNTFIDEQAVMLSAQGVGQKEVARRAAGAVRRANPGLGRGEAQAVGDKIAEDATGQADDMWAAAQMRASEAGLQGAALNQAATADLMQAVQRLMARQQQMLQNGGAMARQARGLNQDVFAMQPADLGRGAW